MTRNTNLELVRRDRFARTAEDAAWLVKALTLVLVVAACLAPAAVAQGHVGVLCRRVTGRSGSQYRVIAGRGVLCRLAESSVPGLTGQLGTASRGFGLRGPAGFHCLALPTPRPAPASRGFCVDPRRDAFSWQPARL